MRLRFAVRSAVRWAHLGGRRTESAGKESRPCTGGCRRPAATVLCTAGALVLATLSCAPTAAVAGPAAAPDSAHVHVGTVSSKRSCSVATRAGEMACDAIKVTGNVSAVQALTRPDLATAATAPAGYGPASLLSAYNLPSGGGGGQTVAVIDAYNDPNAASDLASYRSQYGLPACTTASGCLRQVSQTGSTTSLPAADSGWAEEESLDLDMVSAIAPDAHIILVEASSASAANLGTAVDEAVILGATYISNSYGGSESSSDATYDTKYYDHPGVVVTASAGDSGYGVEYPAASRYVTAVGGTSLTPADNARGWAESVWSTSATEGTGSGCSAYEPKPSWQTDTGCGRRTDNDVAADADPATGVAVYDSYGGDTGWEVFGGTSVAAPLIASVYALAGDPGSTPPQDLYQHTGSLYPVTSGSDGTCSPSYLCTAGSGYNGPSGWGTPDGLTAFTPTNSGTDTVTVTDPGNQSDTTGSAVSLQITASDSGQGRPLTYTATGLPPGLSVNSSSGLITGTPTTTGTSSVTVTAKDTTGASGSTTFTWTVVSSPSCSSPGNVVGNGTFADGSVDWTTTPDVIGKWAPSEPPYTGSYDAWLDGYGTSHTDTLSQSVEIPAGCSASLHLWLHIDSAQTGTANGSFAISIAGTVIGTFTNLNAASGYQEHSYNVSSYAGRTVTLLVTGVETNSRQTSYVVGQIALDAS
jgi:hypothetical protein